MTVISISKLTKKFGTKNALNSVDLELGKGNIGLLGPNGAGKTTLLNLISGVMFPTSGKINVLGEDFDPNNIHIKSKIGYIPEENMMYEYLTPIEFLSFIGKMYDIEKDLLLERIMRYIDLFKLERSDDIIFNLSKGNKQKILLISGILHDPEIILLDEPLNGLDIDAQLIFKKIIDDFKKQGKTIIYSSHVLEVVEKYAEEIIIIDAGAIKYRGMIKDIEHSGKKLENIYIDVLNEH